VGLVVFHVRGRGRARARPFTNSHGYGHAPAVLTSHVSIVAPFCLGGLTAVGISTPASRTTRSLSRVCRMFMGAARWSITALPLSGADFDRAGGLLRQPNGHAGDRLRGGQTTSPLGAVLAMTVVGAGARDPRYQAGLGNDSAGHSSMILVMLFVVRRILPALSSASFANATA